MQPVTYLPNPDSPQLPDFVAKSDQVIGQLSIRTANHMIFMGLLTNQGAKLIFPPQFWRYIAQDSVEGLSHE